MYPLLRLSFCLFIIPGLLQAQEGADLTEMDLREVKSTFFLKENPDDALNYLLQKLPHLNFTGVSVKLEEEVFSPAGKHLLFKQYLNNKQVVGATIKLNLKHSGEVFALFDNSREIRVKPATVFPGKNKVNQLLENLNLEAEELVKLQIEEVYFPIRENLMPALSVEVLNEEYAFTAYLDVDGNELYRESHVHYLHLQGKDSLVNALVFLPDPLTTAKRSYGAPYVDYQDSNLAVLNNEMVNVQLKVNFENGLFTLEGPYVKMTNYKRPSYAPATSITPFFSYDRSQQEFEDINVFFHITAYQEYIQSIGFSNLANYQIHAESHAYMADNSTFVSTFNPPRLSFGEGGVDDAEDADVIIHEYGHAIQHSAAPGTFTGFERKALDEGNSDYFAASYSRSLDDFNWSNVFSWDGHNEFYNGRSADSPKHYPEDYQLSSYHDNAEIWSSALMDIWTKLGLNITDKLVLQSLYGYSANMNMSQAAMLVIAADSLLNNGSHYNEICEVFNKRGFSTICNGFTGFESISQSTAVKDFIQLLNTAAFSEGGSARLQRLSGIENEWSWTLRNSLGAIVGEEIIGSNTIETSIDASDLPRGIYILTVCSREFPDVNLKLIRR